jgi:hypothetical protein
MGVQQELRRSSTEESRRPPMQTGVDGRAREGALQTDGSLTEAPPLRGATPEVGRACKRKLLDEVRDAIRTRHYSDRTETCLPKPGAQAGGLRRIYPAHPDLLSRKIVAW